MALSDNLIGYWPLDEASGNALDAHGSNDLTETSGTIGSTTGLITNARDFVASDSEWFSINDNADLSTGDIDFTIAMWVKRDNYDRCGFGCKTDEWEFMMTNDAYQQFIVRNGGSSGSVNWSSQWSTGALLTGSWVFVVGWHDSVNNLVGLSLNNGTAVTTSYSSGVADTTGTFELGKYAHYTADFFFDGAICEVGFWKRVLTSDERTELYNSGSGRDYSYIAGAASGQPAIKRMGGVKFSAGPFGHAQGVRGW